MQTGMLMLLTSMRLVHSLCSASCLAILNCDTKLQCGWTSLQDVTLVRYLCRAVCAADRLMRSLRACKHVDCSRPDCPCTAETAQRYLQSHCAVCQIGQKTIDLPWY